MTDQSCNSEPVCQSLSDSIEERTVGVKYLANLDESKSRDAAKRLFDLLSTDIRRVSALYHWQIDFKGNVSALKRFMSSYLFPAHYLLVKNKLYELALRFEHKLYNGFIKQCEDERFYKWAFHHLYKPYLETASRKNRSGTDDLRRLRTGTVFFFQNCSPLAHVQLFLEQIESIPAEERDKTYVFALFPCVDKSAIDKLREIGILYFEYPSINKITEKFLRLKELSLKLKISDIVFVSMPLHSPYCSILFSEISLTWWSHKFALSTIPFFDYMVCFRALTKSLRKLDGAEWRAGPIGIAGMERVNLSSASLKKERIEIGVLSREEKTLSSNLPEVIGELIRTYKNIRVTYTARGDGSAIRSRVSSRSDDDAGERIYCVGWVNPAQYLNSIDILLDTPNLGGLSCFWAMSLGLPVISTLPNGSLGSLSDADEIGRFFEVISHESDINRYFNAQSSKPFVLAKFDPMLVKLIIKHLLESAEKRANAGENFKTFFTNYLANVRKSAEIQFEFLGYSNTKGIPRNI